MPPPATQAEYSTYGGKVQGQEVISVEKKKIGRPTDNPRTEKIGFRMSASEIEDIQKCADAMDTQRVNAVIEGIRLLKEKLEI